MCRMAIYSHLSPPTHTIFSESFKVHKMTSRKEYHNPGISMHVFRNSLANSAGKFKGITIYIYIIIYMNYDKDYLVIAT